MIATPAPCSPTMPPRVTSCWARWPRFPMNRHSRPYPRAPPRLSAPSSAGGTRPGGASCPISSAGSCGDGPAAQRRLAPGRPAAAREPPQVPRHRRRYAQDAGPSLTRFIRWLDLLREGKAKIFEAPVSSESVPAVRILTVHKAKGLEFPVVIVAEMGRRYQLGARANALVPDASTSACVSSIGRPTCCASRSRCAC